MSDFRFKISGDSSPFLAELINATTSTKVASQVVEYSGMSLNDRDNYTCAIFNGLLEETDYFVKVTDSIGNINCSSIVSTPTNPIIIPTEISISLLGDKYDPISQEYEGTSSDDNVCALQQPKYINILPEPQDGQCVTLSLDAISCSSSSEVAYIDIYKRCTSSGSYNKVETISQNTCNVLVTICCGDRVCYDMYTELGNDISGSEYACSQLEMNNISAFGYGSCYEINKITDCIDISQTCTQTTTTTTTSEPIIVYFNDSDLLTGTYIKSKVTTLNTFPQLNTNQSFRVHFELINVYDINETLNNEIYQQSRVGIAPDNYELINQENSIKSTGNDNIKNSGYIDVNSGNISDVTIGTTVASSYENYQCDFTQRAIARICKIDNMNGGNFIYDLNEYPSIIEVEMNGDYIGDFNITTTIDDQVTQI